MKFLQIIRLEIVLHSENVISDEVISGQLYIFQYKNNLILYKKFIKTINNYMKIRHSMLIGYVQRKGVYGILVDLVRVLGLGGPTIMEDAGL